MDETLIKMGGERLEKERFFFLQSYCHQIHLWMAPKHIGLKGYLFQTPKFSFPRCLSLN